MSAASISDPASRQRPPALPDFRNLGVMLRILLGVNGLGLAAAVAQGPTLAAAAQLFVEASPQLQPVLLLSLGLLAALSPWLARLSRRGGQLAVLALAAGAAVLVALGWQRLGLVEPSGQRELARFAHAAILAAGSAALLLAYFSLSERARRPAVSEAQVAALTARIRPHFLFNSLNAVLSLIRREPQRAEAALENLAELFRVLMRDPRDLVPLSEEIALCRQYLDLERLRLGERLQVDWLIDAMPADARVPPLMLQPLLENAVYHGIEPADQGGRIAISFHASDGGRRVQIEIRNPLPVAFGQPGSAHTAGNRMALANIRERLALHYDLEASLDTRQEGGVFVVTIALPARPGSLP